MAEAQPAKTSHGLQRAVLWLVIAALLATVWWLASERNERHYRVVPQANGLVIERGRFFPTGTGLAPEKMYAPVPVPAGEKAPGEREFENQNELDRFLFDVLAGWAKNQAKKGETRAAAELVDRASQLPGLNGSQMTELNSLRADLAWDEAKGDLAQAGQSIDAAVRKLELVRQGNGLHAADAAGQQQKLRELRGRLSEIAPSVVPAR
jgi:hypothetical protein